LRIPTLFFTLNPKIGHNPAVSLLCEKNINLDMFQDINLPNAKERGSLASMNPKAHAQFVQTLVNATFTYLFFVKKHFYHRG